MHVLYVSSAKILLWVLIAAILASFSVAQTGAPRHISHLYRTQFSTGEVVSITWHGAQVQGAKELLGDTGHRKHLRIPGTVSRVTVAGA